MDAGTMLNWTKPYDNSILLQKASSYSFYSACISNAVRCFRGNGNNVTHCISLLFFLPAFPLLQLETVSDFYILLCVILPCNWALALFIVSGRCWRPSSTALNSDHNPRSGKTVYLFSKNVAHVVITEILACTWTYFTKTTVFLLIYSTHM